LTTLGCASLRAASPLAVAREDGLACDALQLAAERINSL
jgi:hypothetical protein